jgi:peroxiredoxin
MKTRLLTAALICCLAAPAATFAQAPKKDDKKAPAPKSASELAFDEFQKVRNVPNAKHDQPRFQAVINAGLAFLGAHPTSYRANEVINFLGVNYPTGIDPKRPELRAQYVAMLKLEIANQKYKDGVTEQVRAALLALEAAVSEFEFRMTPGRDSLATLREKIDAMAELAQTNRYLADRERAYAHFLMLMNQTPRAEEQLKKLVAHKEKGVADMAKAELTIIEARKAPFDFKFTSVDGKAVDLASLRGKAVGLYFWATSNKGSVDNLEKLRQFQSDYRKRGFELVTVSFDKEEDRAKVEKYIKDSKLTAPVYFDGKQAKMDVAAKVNVNAPNRLLLISPEGYLQASNINGSLSTNYASALGVFEAEVKKLLKIK